MSRGRALPVPDEPNIFEIAGVPIPFLGGNVPLFHGKASPGGGPVFPGVVRHPREPSAVGVDHEYGAVGLEGSWESDGLRGDAGVVGREGYLLGVGAEDGVHGQAADSRVEEEVQVGAVGADEVQGEGSLACGEYRSSNVRVSSDYVEK